MAACEEVDMDRSSAHNNGCSAKKRNRASPGEVLRVMFGSPTCMRLLVVVRVPDMRLKQL
jgi:hypothetical protein